jgi:glucose-6-phosphate-specific signal transduction histidine kinase
VSTVKNAAKKMKKNKKPGKIGTLFAVGSTVTLAPVLLRRFKDARRDGDKLALADAAVSGAALLVGVAQVLRGRKGAGRTGV